MTQIQKLYTSRLRHPEFAQLVVRFLDDLDKKGLSVAKEDIVEKLLTDLRTNLPHFQQSLEQVRASEKSVSISEADEQRDADFQALRDSIKPYRVSKREAEKSAYASLKLLFDQYKDTAKANYEQETALLTSLLEKLRSSYSDQISVLEIEKFVSNLEESHRDFETRFSSRSQESLTKVSYDVKALRKAVLTPYQDLTEYLAIMVRVKDEALYKDLLEVLNNSRKYYADILSRRKVTKEEVTA
ncbi:TPA: hypothetical protein U0910_000007 [Streptococcus suis 8830]|uniref:DUF6261 family protein n=1 Tax=Streptococcus suis TaxID=1307 RepID=UPI0004037D22|nr:DUF6261 family protein [Streptococcus suis]HEM3202016.1 hypothetical protein [Streptococcus suis 8830]